MNFRSYAAATLTVILWTFSLAQDSSPQQRSLQTDYRIGFTLTPDSVSHQGNEGMRAAIIDPTSSARTINLLNTPYVPVGTQFAGWLRDGNVLLTTTHVLKSPRCEDSTFKGVLGRNCEVLPLVVDSYVANPKTGVIKYCLTCDLHNDQSTDYLYSQTPQPVYSSKAKDVSYYVISTHHGPINPEGTATLTKVFKVGPQGQPPSDKKPLLAFDVLVHGCQISPDGNWLACEPLNRPKDRDGNYNPTEAKFPGGHYCWDGVILVETKTGAESCVGNIAEYSGDSVAIWSPDSNGFLYFSQDRENAPEKGWRPTKGWLNYYKLKTKTGFPIRVAKGTTPTYFCKLLVPCEAIGRGPTWSPCWKENPCQNEFGDSKWLYFSAYYPAPSASAASQVIGKVSLDRPDKFIPVTEELGLDAGYPVISVDGSRLAFLATESSTDRRRQLYTMEFKSCKPDFKSCNFVKLTWFDARSFTGADTPNWPAR
jgi:hypothetical protein